jgi:hypothetical protein
VQKTLYSIAIFAIKPDPALNMDLSVDSLVIREESEGNEDTVVRNFHHVSSVVAGSDNAFDEKDAQELGMAEAKRIFPESQGWRGHSVTMSAIPDDIVLVAAVYAEQRLSAWPDVQEYEM